MSYGFVIRDVNGAEVISNNSLGILLLETFVVNSGGSITKTYPGMASSEVKVMSSPIGARFTGGTITITNSGADKVVNITGITNQTRFFVSRE